MFFPGRNQSDRANAAKMICFECPVIFQCRDYKQRSGSTHGIWGGQYFQQDD